MSEYRSKRVQQKRHRRRRAHLRVRHRVVGTAERPRLAVYKSLKYVYAQVIDDATGCTLAQASSLDASLRGELKGATGNVAAAELVGKTIADRAKSKGIERVVFDRGGYIYHGKVKAIAEAARKNGLEF